MRKAWSDVEAWQVVAGAQRSGWVDQGGQVRGGLVEGRLALAEVAEDDDVLPVGDEAGGDLPDLVGLTFAFGTASRSIY